MIAVPNSSKKPSSVWVVAAMGMLLVFILGGQTQSAAPFEQVTRSTLRPDDPIPAPQGQIVLKVFGASKSTGGRTPLRLDRKTLEGLGLIRFTSRNIWYDQPVTYEGVLGSVFLDFVGVPAGATQMKLRALNDYVVRIPLADFRRWPVMLALKLNGQYMSVRDKGPIWIVYPNHLASHLMSRTYQGRWIWQLAEIRFE